MRVILTWMAPRLLTLSGCADEEDGVCTAQYVPQLRLEISCDSIPANDPSLQGPLALEVQEKGQEIWHRCHFADAPYPPCQASMSPMQGLVCSVDAFRGRRPSRIKAQVRARQGERMTDNVAVTLTSDRCHFATQTVQLTYD